MKVACLMHRPNRRYKLICEAMSKGIIACGDEAEITRAETRIQADAGVIYGWKFSHLARQYGQFVYADLGFWQRETYYRITANGWGPESYVRAGLPVDRLQSMGVVIQPWRKGKGSVLLAGSSAKSAIQHGTPYMQWETRMAAQLMKLGYLVTYRPKPGDKQMQRIDGCALDTGPLEESLRGSIAVVTHHSNLAVKALAEGVPVHCVTGAAAAFSNPLESLTERQTGREQFLADVAWLQWSLEEMRSGACWRHLKDRGLIQ